MKRGLILWTGLFLLSSSAWSAGTLKVTTPNGGQKWTTGKSYAIKWSKGSAGAKVKIQLLKSNKHYKWVSKKTKNDGKHTWKIPSTLANSSAYKIKITSIKSKKVFDTSNKTFKITKTSGGDGSSLTVTSLNGGQKWTTGKTYQIKWSKGNAGAKVKIQLLKNGNAYKWITKSTKNDGKHTWKIPTTVATASTYKIKITSTSKKTVTDSSNSTFTITNNGNNGGSTTSKGAKAKAGGKYSVELFKSLENVIYKPGKKYNIRWKTKGYRKSATAQFVLQRTTSGVIKSLKGSESGLPGNLVNTGSYRWKIPSNLPEGANYTIVIFMKGRGTPHPIEEWSSWVDIVIGKAGAGTLPPGRYPKGNYVHLQKLNAFKLARHTIRWKSKTIYVSGANKPSWRKAINIWKPAVKFKYVKKKPAVGKGIHIVRMKLGASTCGQAFYSYKANGQFLTCKAATNSRWSASKYKKLCGSEAGVVTHEGGHCIGLMTHSNAIASADYGLMDGVAGCSWAWPNCKIHPKVKNMVSLLYRLPPGTNIKSKLKKGQTSKQDKTDKKLDAAGDQIYYGSIELRTNGDVKLLNGW